MDEAKENNKTDCVAVLVRAAELFAASPEGQRAVRPWVGASVIVDLVCFVVVSFEGRAFHPIRLYVHALNPPPPTTTPALPTTTHTRLLTIYTHLYLSISTPASPNPHHQPPPPPPHSTSLCCMHCDILQAALLDKARAELGSGGDDQLITQAINGGFLESKDQVRDEWGGVTYI